MIRYLLVSFLVSSVLIASPAAVARDKPIDPKKVAKIDPKVVREVDRFTGDVVYRSKRGGGTDGTGLLVTVNVYPLLIVPEGKAPVFGLRTWYLGLGWRFLTGKVNVLLDGSRRLTLEGPDSSGEREVMGCTGIGCNNSEYLNTPVTREDLEAMVAAQRIEMRFNGKEGSPVVRLKAEHVAVIKELLSIADKLAPPAAPPSSATDDLTPEQIQELMDLEPGSQ